ncbi:MAG: glycosyltransferase family 2 protein [Flavobacteriaceae bacterium]|nr:glycosyltransferase family 2 protein [Flavobacteriaceae bacterium]
MENNALVSVVITTYNRATYLESAIQSVVQQTYKNIEIIVVDDGSTIDYAAAICSKYPQCTYHFKKNGGLSSSRNYGVSVSKGAFIAFLDDDDLFLPNKIALQVALLTTKLNIDCVHSSAMIIDANDVPTGEIIGASALKEHKRTGNVFWNALGVWVIKSPTPLFRREVFSDITFDETILVGEDVDFYQRMFYRHKVFYVKEPLALYREDDDPNRLSKKTAQYVGLETKIYSNFIKMGIKNPFTLYKIALRLAQAGISRLNTAGGAPIVTISKWKLFLNPFYYVKNLNNLKK